MIKMLNNKLEIEGNFFNLKMGIYKKSTINIFTDEILNLLPLSLVKRCLFLPLLFNIILEILTRAIKRGKERKCIQNEKEEVKLSLFADNMILYIENHKEPIHTYIHIYNQKQYTHTNIFSKLHDTRLTYESHFFFYTLVVNNLKMKTGRQCPLQQHKKE